MSEVPWQIGGFKPKRFLPRLLAWLGCAAALLLAAASPGAAAPPQRKEWQIDGATREALVYVPATAAKAPAPVVFAFHGRGGGMTFVAKKWSYHTRWPEAICVYPQGLPTPGGQNNPEGKKSGWQTDAGEQGDRDLRFVDAILASLRKDHKIDEKRIYVSGFSNGGRFTYLLWAQRPEVLAAVAPCAHPATDLVPYLKPKPCLHVAGQKDAKVGFAEQEATMAAVRKLNGCRPKGKPDGTGLTVYRSPKGTPFVAYVHPGGHQFPADTPEKIVAFFKQHARK